MKTRIFSAVTMAVALGGLSLIPLARGADSTVPRAPMMSAGLDDVIKMTKSGVDESVISTYVKTSQTPYSPSAQEVIQLREQGVSSTVITTLMSRGNEVRQANAEVQKQEQQAIAAAPKVAPMPDTSSYYAAAPAYYTPPVTYVAPQPVYSYAPASSVVYIGGPRYTYASPYRYQSGFVGPYPNYYSPYYSSYRPFYGPRVSVGVGFGGHSGVRGGVRIGF